MQDGSVAPAVTKFTVPALLRLMRPANIVTAYADILAGYACGGDSHPERLLALLIATTGLYGGGVVLNDVFDASLDRTERPERPIPSGAVSKRLAGTFGAALLVGGVCFASLCSPLSGVIALAAAASALLYDSWGKHQSIIGPLNMGLCRGLNLLLGISAIGTFPLTKASVGLVTLSYIAGVTALSRGEVLGGTRGAATIAVAWLCAGALLMSALIFQAWHGGAIVNCALAVGLLGLLMARLIGPWTRAMRTLEPRFIGLAIKAGVLSLIILDSALGALYGGPWFAACILLLYLPAIGLARLFAVT